MREASRGDPWRHPGLPIREASRGDPWMLTELPMREASRGDPRRLIELPTREASRAIQGGSLSYPYVRRHGAILEPYQASRGESWRLTKLLKREASRGDPWKAYIGYHRVSHCDPCARHLCSPV